MYADAQTPSATTATAPRPIEFYSTTGATTRHAIRPRTAAVRGYLEAAFARKGYATQPTALHTGVSRERSDLVMGPADAYGVPRITPVHIADAALEVATIARSLPRAERADAVAVAAHLRILADPRSDRTRAIDAARGSLERDRDLAPHALPLIAHRSALEPRAALPSVI
jgi:hypothetical protein